MASAAMRRPHQEPHATLAARCSCGGARGTCATDLKQPEADTMAALRALRALQELPPGTPQLARKPGRTCSGDGLADGQCPRNLRILHKPC